MIKHIGFGNRMKEASGVRFMVRVPILCLSNPEKFKLNLVSGHGVESMFFLLNS